MISNKKILAAVLLAASCAQVHAANLIKNGFFEQAGVPPVSAGSYQVYPVGSKGIPFWTVVGANPGADVALVSTTYTGNGFLCNAHTGTQSVDLTGDISGGFAGLSQTVPTVAGQTYTLSFWVGNLYDVKGFDGLSSTVAAYVNNQLVIMATNSNGKGVNHIVWQKFTVTLTATGPSTTIALYNDDPYGDNYNGLDDVQLTPVTTAADAN